MLSENKVFIATPMYGGVCLSSYMIGMLDTLEKLGNDGYGLLFSSITNESLITRARNELVRQFLKTDAKYFIFIDADIGFSGDDVLRLIKADKDVICGPYPKKTIDWDRINVASSNGKTNLQDYASSYVVNTLDNIDLDTQITSSIVEVKHSGTGFMLIRRNVFEQLSPHVKEYVSSTIPNRDGTSYPLTKEFFTTSIEEGTNYLMSEDYYFCELWKKHGGKVYIDTDIKLSHTGTYMFQGSLRVGGLNIS